MILKDNNTEYELSNGNSYSFSSDATATNSRFSILFKSNGTVTSTENKKVNNVIVNSSNNEISIITDGDSNNNAKAIVYNSIGKEVKTLNLKPGINRLSSISTGVYIVQINTNKNNREHKHVNKKNNPLQKGTLKKKKKKKKEIPMPRNFNHHFGQ